MSERGGEWRGRERGGGGEGERVSERGGEGRGRGRQGQGGVDKEENGGYKENKLIPEQYFNTC